MTISSGAMGAAIGRLMVENAINNKETNETLREAMEKSELGMMEVDAAMEKNANDLGAAKRVIGMASSAVSVGRAADSLGQAVQDGQDYNSTVPQLQEGLDTEEAGGGASALGEVRLGRDGQTVAQRFSGERLETLTNENSINEIYDGYLNQDPPMTPAQAEQATLRELERRGFSSGEAAQLFRQGKSVVQELRQGHLDDGMTPSQADAATLADLKERGFTDAEARQAVADGTNGLSDESVTSFMWNNRKTEEQRLAEQMRDKIYDAIQSITVEALGVGLDKTAEQEKRNGKEVADAGHGLDAVAREAISQGTSHQQAIDSILTEGLTKDAQPTKN